MLFIDAIWFHIKSEHDVFPDGTEQKCLSFSQMSFCFFIATQWERHDVNFTLIDATFLRFNLQMTKFVPVLKLRL